MLSHNDKGEGYSYLQWVRDQYAEACTKEYTRYLSYSEMDTLLHWIETQSQADTGFPTRVYRVVGMPNALFLFEKLKEDASPALAKNWVTLTPENDPSKLGIDSWDVKKRVVFYHCGYDGKNILYIYDPNP